MPIIDTTWYVNFGDGSTTGYYAVTRRPQNAAVAAGQLVRQFTAPAVASERVFVCIIAGTTANTTDASWNTSRGSKTIDGTATWQECTGSASVNGDATNTYTWASFKVAGGSAPSLGQLIKRNNGASYQIATQSGTTGASEPAFSDTAGVTTTDNGAIWTSLGPVSNFTGGQAPVPRLGTVFGAGWFASGNTVYVGDNHAETQTTNMTLSPASALMARIICHNRSGSYPPTSSDITTGATITTTGATTMTIGGLGSFYFYGITFQTGTNGYTLGAAGVTQVQNWYYFDNCSFALTGSYILLGATGTAWGIYIFNNTTVKFSAATGYINPYFVQFTWQNTGQILAAGSSVPTTLFQSTGTSGGRFSTITLRNLDLSQLTGSLFSNTSNSSIGSLIVQDCKLNAAMTVTTPINSGMTVQLIRSDSAATAYKSTRYQYEGTETTETSIVRTDGAVDPNGQAQARKIVTSANAQWLRPFKAEPMAIWNDDVGSAVTATVCGTVNAGALPNNDDIWLETEYLTSTSPPVTLDTATTFETSLTNGNLTATRTAYSGSQYGGARNVNYLSSGKYYFEVTTVVRTGNSSAGIVLSTGTYLDAVNNLVNCSVVSGNAIWSNNTNTGRQTVDSLNAGVVLCCAVDLTARLIWFRTNGTQWNGFVLAGDPAAGTGGLAVGSGSFAPVIGLGLNSLTSSSTINFGATAYAQTPPSGFGNWPAVDPPAVLGTIVTTTKSNVLATAAAVASDSSMWALPAYATFDGTPSTANIGLSNGNLTVTKIITFGGGYVSSLVVQSSGKYYFEITNTVKTSGTGDILGIAGPGVQLPDPNSVAVTVGNASWIYVNGADQGKNLGTAAQGDVWGFAIDLTARLFWARRNAGNWNATVGADPATGVSGLTIPTGSFTPSVYLSTGNNVNSHTANFGASSFVGAVPSGFAAGWIARTPFKLASTITPQLPGYIHARVRVGKASATYYVDPKIVIT